MPFLSPYRISFSSNLFPLGGAWVFLFLFSCQSESISPSTKRTPEEIMPYLIRFKQEAIKRGVNVSWEELEIHLVDGNHETKAAGICHLYYTRSPKIFIDTTSFNWKHSEWTREILVFHELGHTLLNRSHRNDRLPNGLYASIMRETGDPLYGGDVNAFKRSYYLDELFNEDITRPLWAQNNLQAWDSNRWDREYIFIENFQEGGKGWPQRENPGMQMKITDGNYLFAVKNKGAYFSGKVIPLDIHQNFEIAASMKIKNGENPVLLQWGGKSPGNMLYLGFTTDQYAFAGKRNEGTSTGRKFIPVNPRDYNLLTVQKVSDKYLLYINRQLFDVIDYTPFNGNLWGFYIGSETSLEVDFLEISYLIDKE